MQPKLIEPLDNIVINVGAAFGPLDLTPSFEGDAPLQFSASLVTGGGLPAGLICTGDGQLTGIPAKETVGDYEVMVEVKNAEGSITAEFYVSIKPALSAISESSEERNKLKTTVWDAIEKNIPLPQLEDLMSLPITDNDIYYLLERWSYFIVWDAFNFDSPSAKSALQLEGASPHYHVYDCGSHIIMCPKDLHSHERTIGHAMQTIKALAKEVHGRDWTIEMAGLDKFTRKMWLEYQLLNNKLNKSLEIINYQPDANTMRNYQNQTDNSPRLDLG